MNCCCDIGQATKLKIEGDIGADPIWCNCCGKNLDLVDIPISEKLAGQLLDWSRKYGEWIDWERDRLKVSGKELEEAHNRKGALFTERVKQEVGDQYKVIFSPSTSVQIYIKHNEKQE
ncbi:hypothetical protein [Siminovitchia sp. 179-K 8D1 HS]|uniref:hypothetical protein n=1 Tax=Siminovitchia sp. 179-K 8D1 HS TaxID=3142385 RepID=UPI0039A32F84